MTVTTATSSIFQKQACRLSQARRERSGRSLPRERVEYDIPDDQKACPSCHGKMHRMGEAVTEKIPVPNGLNYWGHVSPQRAHLRGLRKPGAHE